MKTFFELNKKFNKIKNNGWILSQGNGNGAGGITFEKLLNIQTNNFEIPDFKDIELKVKYSNKEKYISLFNATPDSFLYEIKRINVNDNIRMYKKCNIKMHTFVHSFLLYF